MGYFFTYMSYHQTLIISFPEHNFETQKWSPKNPSIELSVDTDESVKMGKYRIIVCTLTLGFLKTKG